MSIDPNVMSQMLTQQLLQPPQAGSYGGGNAGPAMQGSISPMNAAATLTSKLMLMKALQGQQQRQQQGVANSMLPGTNAQIANNPSMQALQQSPQMDPNLLAQLQQSTPIAPPMPTPGGVPGQ